MNSHFRLTLTVISILLCCSVCQAQKAPAKYSDYDRGNYYYYYQKWDSAFLMYNRYLEHPTDSLEKAKAYNYMGQMQWIIGDIYGAQQSLTGVIHTLDPADTAHRTDLGYAYNLLGNLSKDLKRYDEAINFYNSAIHFFKDSPYALEITNGKALVFQQKKSYAVAIAMYDSMLTVKPADQSLLARIIDNRARTKWLQDPESGVLPDFHAALKIRTDIQDEAGFIASYAHLSDYYAKSNPDSALWYARQMHDQASKNQNPDDMLEAIDKLIRLNSNTAVKENWYEAYRTINDSLQLSRDTTRNRFALIRYDVQKGKADNLQLQQHISMQRLLMYALIATAILVIIGLWSSYNRHRKKISRDSENAIRNARLKTSQKVHDVVANGLYGIMNELEHTDQIQREPLINRIEGLYEQSRNISYEDAPAAENSNYDQQVHQLLNAFSNETTKLIVVGNQQTFWNNISAAQKQELQLILRELMINMKKHSRAGNVLVHFKQDAGNGMIQYKDDGVGMPSEAAFGNGLNNTVSRIKSLNGEINFEKSERAGVSIAISFPLEMTPHD
ncbi:MAG: sensory box histidine kinase [Ferruginibacter sp.]|nr:sensory box histidine kinase [Ferruginibacter sp.]